MEGTPPDQQKFAVEGSLDVQSTSSSDPAQSSTEAPPQGQSPSPAGGGNQTVESDSSQTANPSESPDTAAPLADGQTAQEQATGDSSAGTSIPVGEPGGVDGPAPGTQLAAAHAAQEENASQTIPEQRPTAVDGAGVAVVSESSKRLDNNVAASPEDFERADSDEAKEASKENSRFPNLVIGQRVTIIDGPEAGRMAYVDRIEYTDGIQQMLSASGQPEARFAEVENYIVRTRDGRSDTLTVDPAHIKPLDDIEGWGRGQI